MASNVTEARMRVPVSSAGKVGCYSWSGIASIGVACGEFAIRPPEPERSISLASSRSSPSQGRRNRAISGPDRQGRRPFTPCPNATASETDLVTIWFGGVELRGAPSGPTDPQRSRR